MADRPTESLKGLGMKSRACSCELGWRQSLARLPCRFIEGRIVKKYMDYSIDAITGLRNLSIVLGALFLLLAASPSATRADSGIGKPAPALSGALMDGQPVDLSAMQGKIVIVHFWATWCPLCKSEMVEIDSYYRQFHSQGVEVIAVSDDRPHDKKETRKEMQQFAFSSMMIHDAKRNGFGEPDSLPETYVIDSRGTMVAAFVDGKPRVTVKLLTDTIAPILPEAASPRFASPSPNGEKKGAL